MNVADLRKYQVIFSFLVFMAKNAVDQYGQRKSKRCYSTKAPKQVIKRKDWNTQGRLAVVVCVMRCGDNVLLGGENGLN